MGAALTVLPPSAIGSNVYTTLTSIDPAITATASGTQTTGYPIQAQLNVVSTVGTNADSVTLPKIKNRAEGSANLGQVGMVIAIQNITGNTLQVYGTTPDTVNAIATGTGLAMTTGQKALFICTGYTAATDVGTWITILSA